MNTYGKLSLLTVGICIVLSYFITDNMAYPRLFLLMATIVSVTGIVFAILSKKMVSMIFGILLIALIWVILFILVLVVGIGIN